MIRPQPRSTSWTDSPHRHLAVLCLLVHASIAMPPAAAIAQPIVIDACESIGSWKALPSDGVNASLALTEGVTGKAIRLDYNFEAGSGFVVLRREFSLPIPENYRFTFHVKGDSPPNNLEFKLVSGDDVWWVNNRAYEFPRDWKRTQYRARHLSFAWGPSAGRRQESIDAIEFAIAASSGGAGSVCFDELTFEPLPVPAPVHAVPAIRFSSAAPGSPERLELPADGRFEWASTGTDRQPVIDIDLGQVREFGGLILDWDEHKYPWAYEILASPDGLAFESVARIAPSGAGRRYLPLADSEARALRIRVVHTGTFDTIALHGLEIAGIPFGATHNAVFERIARDAKRGAYPRTFLGEQNYWTVVGTAGDSREALLSADGALELAKQGFTIEPFLHAGGRLISWADARIEHSLEEGYLPIPAVTWSAGDLRLAITAFADGPPARSRVVARYTVSNAGSERRLGNFILALRPFQVLPPWQALNITGGVARIDTIDLRDDGLLVNASQPILMPIAPRVRILSNFYRGEAIERYARADTVSPPALADETGRGSAVMSYMFNLEPGASLAIPIEIPLHLGDAGPAGDPSDVEARGAVVAAQWRSATGRARIGLPPGNERLVDTFRTQQAYILINRDGPSIQPGSRTYERSWIRDGCLTGASLLYTGHADAMREFLDWYAPFQYTSGKVPCVVDARGPDPVPEHDSHGEYIFAVWKCYRVTRDRAFLERHWTHVAAAAGYIQSLRAQRLTPEYETGDQRAFRGLVPESISHEGYSAKPMHSYWDDFFCLRGIADAAAIARELGRPEADEFARARDDFGVCIRESIALTMREKGIEYIPGCVELGDFDATSTAIAVSACGLQDDLPVEALDATLEKYWAFFQDRRDGRLEWEAYTPYEMRIVQALVKLGKPERAHALLDCFMNDRRPAPWNHWAEVVWREPSDPRFIGDMPHTWCGSEFVNAVRSMFVYEDRDGLILAAGVPSVWVEAAPGVRIDDFPTEFGIVSYGLHEADGAWILDLDGSRVEGGTRCVLALARPAARIEVDGRELPGGPIEFDASARRIVVTLTE